MPSRQDQLHSHQFTIQRVVAALVMRETDPSQSPFRRAMGATLASVLIAAIGLGGVAAYALITGSGAKIGSDVKEVLVEKETGANYVRYNGRLHPVANFTSAILIAGSDKVRRVSRSSLIGQDRGPMLGLPEVPDSLPGPKELTANPWAICSGKVLDQTQSVLFVGRVPAGGTELPSGQAVVVRNTSNDEYLLVWHRPERGGFWKFPMPDHQAYASYISVSGALPVTQGLVNAFQLGDGLERSKLANKGQRSTRFTGYKIGQVISKEETSTQEFFMVKDTKMARVTAFQADLLLNDPDYQSISASGLTKLSSTAFNNLAPADTLEALAPTNLPTTKPATIETPKSLCATVQNGQPVDSLRYGIDLPPLPAQTPGKAKGGRALADRVDMEPGRGVLVESKATKDAPGSLALVVGGRRYDLSDPKVKGMLGYGKAKPTQIPSTLVSLLPAGSSLNPEAAAKEFKPEPSERSTEPPQPSPQVQPAAPATPAGP